MGLTKDINFDELKSIDGIGETQINSLISFFNNSDNLNILKELQKILIIQDTTV